MDESGLSTLPGNAVIAKLAYDLLGPTAKYLGDKGQGYSQKAVENIERMFAEGYRRLGDEWRNRGEVPPRLLHTSLEQGAFTENVIASGYLGGVLASSRCDDTSDDRGVAINKKIESMSSYTIRLHYLLYTAMHDLFQGVPANSVMDRYQQMQMWISDVAVYVGMGFMESEEREMESEPWSIVNHALRSLLNSDLIQQWECHDRDGRKYSFSPTWSGIELYLWANGFGKKSESYYFDRAFEPHEFENGEVTFIPGRNCKVWPPEDNDEDEPIFIDGYFVGMMFGQDYACPVECDLRGRDAQLESMATDSETPLIDQ